MYFLFDCDYLSLVGAPLSDLPHLVYIIPAVLGPPLGGGHLGFHLLIRFCLLDLVLP